MPVQNFPPILRCPLCNKPFEKQSTLTRHGYYCRSRKVGKVNRLKACLACIRAKTRCDHGRPGCSRCDTKGFECVYAARLTQDETQSRLEQGAEEQSEGSKFAKTASAFNSFISQPPGLQDLQQVIPSENTDNTALWYPGVTDGFTDFLPWNFDTDMFRQISIMNTVSPINPMITSAPLSIPVSPTNTNRSLVTRQSPDNGIRRTSKLIHHTLKSYPLMLLRDDTLPPFVHSVLVNLPDQTENMESLTNCLSLMRLIGDGVRKHSGSGRKLFWKNVQQECARLHHECLSLNKWQVLAAMQALAIYTLVRLDEGETPYNNIDSLLVATVTKLSQYFNSTGPFHRSAKAESWLDWLYRESFHRVCVVFQVCNMLVWFDPASLCDHPADLLIVPLPCPKRLWEAEDALSWNVEAARHPEAEACYALAKSGDLVKVDITQIWSGGKNRTGQGQVVDWNEWCVGVDGLGGLILLAAAMV